MIDTTGSIHSPSQNIYEKQSPICPVFNECGGCLYQDISYEKELEIKETDLRKLFEDNFQLDKNIFNKIIPSPKSYYYRNRLDLKLHRTKDKKIYIGFTPKPRDLRKNNKSSWPKQFNKIIPVDRCFIADEAISEYIPKVKEEAISKLPEKKYRQANLVIRTGDDKRIFWGGIGKRSCRLDEKDYLWTKIKGRKIFYSLDTFFQANLSILNKLFDKIFNLEIWEENTIFYDLFGGVGLFGIGLADKVNKVVLIEECVASLRLAKFNVEYNKLKNFEIIDGKVEDVLNDSLPDKKSYNEIAMIDPPRAGLSKEALDILKNLKRLKYILYLSCNPESLIRDLKCFIYEGWKVKEVIPFDFFPKTKHLETLILLKS